MRALGCARGSIVSWAMAHSLAISQIRALCYHRRYFLPPIIFYAGLSCKKKHFFRNFGSIAMFGIVGTYCLFAIIAFFLYGISKLPNILTTAVRLQACGVFSLPGSCSIPRICALRPILMFLSKPECCAVDARVQSCSHGSVAVLQVASI